TPASGAETARGRREIRRSRADCALLLADKPPNEETPAQKASTHHRVARSPLCMGGGPYRHSRASERRCRAARLGRQWHGVPERVRARRWSEKSSDRLPRLDLGCGGTYPKR